MLEADEALLPSAALLGDAKTRCSAFSSNSCCAASGLEGVVGDVGSRRGSDWRSTAALADDIGIGADIGGTGCIAGQGAEIGETAGIIEFAVLVQPLGQRDDIEGLPSLGQLADGAEDQPVIRCGRNRPR